MRIIRFQVDRSSPLPQAVHCILRSRTIATPRSDSGPFSEHLRDDGGKSITLVAACDDLTNFASHRDFLLARKKRHTSRTHPIVKTGISHLIEEKMANRP